MTKPAVFLDRDGVLVEDEGLLAPVTLRLLPGVPKALARLQRAGFALVVITNQPIVARGLAREVDVERAHEEIRTRIEDAGGPRLEHFYYCPHHPRATLEPYRVDCECRKPKPGLLRRAAAELDLDLTRAYMVGDRISDVAAGAAAGCRTILVETGRHLDPPIETITPIDRTLRADSICADLPAAVDWILRQ
ncbi:MAG: D-glycero-alpha-D-manno-heptose-1,7-bisphosphate 7-phosphatase [Thermoanaerobaculia bacterium]